MTLEDMLKTPGFYAVSAPGSPYYTVVEVEPDGTVHQLTPSGARDGVLPADGWAPGIVIRKTGRPS